MTGSFMARADDELGLAKLFLLLAEICGALKQSVQVNLNPVES